MGLVDQDNLRERVEVMGQVLPQVLEWNLSYKVE